VISIPIPFLFDQPPVSVWSADYFKVISEGARAVESLAFVPLDWVERLDFRSEFVAPVVVPAQVERVAGDYQLIELDGWDKDAYAQLSDHFPDAVVAVRLPLGSNLEAPLEAGVSTFHLTANYHGQSQAGFIMEAVRDVHQDLVDRGLRQSVTLLGSGGIVAAEHVPKAIIAGLDAVALDLSPVLALQGRMQDECIEQATAQIELPPLDTSWGSQRIQNMTASWRDQLLEILGAMGLREVRRLRGELGRAMFQIELEREAFSEIEGFGGAA
jgi:hypothetical protein